MPDIEKVIKAYEDFVNGYECFCTSDDYEYEMHKAVLALLKEQETVVRCKDCKFHHASEKLNKCWCEKDFIEGYHNREWFCADGERMEE